MSQNLPLAAQYYVDRDCFEIDKEKVFYRSWQCVCHVSEFSKSGDFKTHTIADESMFVIRDTDGQLQAYYNICRHRGHPIVEGQGKARQG
ncbi:MAG: phenylpropionate dioxygenase-like ring-hydroxylating dioxygenase large terminal subunit [Gammaproteobacteria bacterium]|jgi:phenylpropionate dioxygenase-like ring-hydroxylating dioxygenase large terminal subunit